MKRKTEVRIIHPSIDDFNDTVVIRGVVDNDSLQNLKIDSYQRELLPGRSRNNIRHAVMSGERLPDITLGMRGDEYGMDGEVLVLADPVYIIDGQQRCGTILEMCWDNIPATRLGATIHLNTSTDWERELFHKLNLFQSKVSPNILLRNIKEDHHALTMLYGLTKNDKNFVLHDRVCWKQGMAKGEILTAMTLLGTSLTMHTHIAGTAPRSVARAVPLSDRLIDKIGMMVFRDNAKNLFNLIDECWGIRTATLRGGAPYMRSAFLFVLARLISDHLDFWKQPEDRRFQIDYTLKRKLAKFPIGDPEIVRLTGAHGASVNTLYFHLLTHLNSGKRTKRLRSRNASVNIETNEDIEEESEIDVV